MALAPSKVKAPLIAQCHANLECRVVDTRLVNRYNFFVLEVVAAWIDPLRRDAPTLHHRGWVLSWSQARRSGCARAKSDGAGAVAKMRHATRMRPPWTCN